MSTLTPSPPPEAALSEDSERKENPQLRVARDFIQILTGWRETDRGRLAQLKRNVGEPLPGRGVSWIYNEFYRLDIPPYRHEAFFLIATVFDLNRFQTERGDSHFGSLGASMRLFVERTSKSDEAKKKGLEQVGRRLQILLDADFEEGAASELAFRLRQTVQWLTGQKVGLDYAQLLTDLGAWSHPDRFIQKKWARDFYNVRPFEPNQPSSNPTT